MLLNATSNITHYLGDGFELWFTGADCDARWWNMSRPRPYSANFSIMENSLACENSKIYVATYDSFYGNNTNATVVSNDTLQQPLIIDQVCDQITNECSFRVKLPKRPDSVFNTIEPKAFVTLPETIYTAMLQSLTDKDNAKTACDAKVLEAQNNYVSMKEQSTRVQSELETAKSSIDTYKQVIQGQDERLNQTQTQSLALQAQAMDSYLRGTELGYNQSAVQCKIEKDRTALWVKVGGGVVLALILLSIAYLKYVPYKSKF